MRVFVDIGHGGSDGGASSFGLVEKEINLAVGLYLKQLLIDSGFDVKLSRENDIFIDLRDRSNMANNWKSDIFVSVHHNASGGDGWEIIHSMMSNKKDKSRKLAEYIGKEFTNIGQNPRQKPIFSRESTNYPGNDYYTVLRYCNMPCVITEFAFLDSNDRFIIDTSEKMKKEAEAIYKGICSFFNVISSQNQHWAEKYWLWLNNNGVTVHDKRFDDVATRGDVMTLIARSMGCKE